MLGNKNKVLKLTAGAIISFIVTFSLCAAMVCFNVINRTKVDVLMMEQLIIEKSAKANEVLSRLLYKTQTLSSLIQQNNGDLTNFQQFAATVIDDPAILNVLAAPEGIVTEVYPIAGNEAVIGLNFFDEGAGNKEALLAKESGQLVFGGPFDAVQGSQVLVGRLPVYIPDSDGVNKLWGLVSVTLKYPQALDGVGLKELYYQGFAYEIWRINPDNSQKQIISSSDYYMKKNTRYIEKHVKIQNANWYFRILPVRAWYEYPDTWLAVSLGLCISFLVALVFQNNAELKAVKSHYETLSHLDPLTGIYNRRYFMEKASALTEKLSRTGSDAFLLLFDIDHFKSINDNYGHLIGDEVLKGVVARVSEVVRPSDMFSRFGGEEFIIFVSGLDESSAFGLAERVRLFVSEKPFTYGNMQIAVTVSFGVSRTSPSYNVEKTIDLADNALYKAKNEGRNKVVVYRELDRPVPAVDC